MSIVTVGMFAQCKQSVSSMINLSLCLMFFSLHLLVAPCMYFPLKE